MSNINENRINITLIAADVTSINQSITSILTKMPANTALSEDERSRYNAIDVANKVFVEDTLQEALTTGTGIVASYINLPVLQNDITIYNQMDVIETGLSNLLQRVKDVKRIAGHEAYKVSNRVYNNYKDAAEIGVDNAQSAYDRLKVRYDAQGNAGRPDAPSV